jgi:hypothetical protein
MLAAQLLLIARGDFKEAPSLRKGSRRGFFAITLVTACTSVPELTLPLDVFGTCRSTHELFQHIYEPLAFLVS